MRETKKMNGIFAREVYIRFSEDGMHFVCTTEYGRFYRKTEEFAFDGPSTPESAPELTDDASALLLRKRHSDRTPEQR
jgi:hypothetical protein